MQNQMKGLENFREKIKSDVGINRSIQGEGARKAFVTTMIGLIPDEEADNVEPVYLDERVGTRRVAVDGYAYNNSENTLLLVIADWNEFDETLLLTKTDAEGYLKRLRNFFQLARKGKLQDPAADILEWSSPEYGLAETIEKECIERVRLLLVTDRRLSDKFKKVGSEPIEGLPVDEQVWGLERLYEHFMSGREHEPVVLDFSDAPISLTRSATGEGFRSFLGVMPATKLAAVYREHGGRLLEGNVRSFLTLRSIVNKSIRETILRSPERFFIYNNGIACTAKDLVFNAKGQLVQATDFQIINGGQTTASLARAVHSDKADLSAIQVALKLTEIDDSLPEAEASELIRNISRWSNNQNKVSGADFSANHPFHVQMEKFAARLVAPPAPGRLRGSYWFYERSRGSYLQKQMFMTDAEQKAFAAHSDKKHVIKKEAFARARLLWEQRPDIVSKGATALFAYFMQEIDEDWEKSRDAGKYGEDYFKETVALIIMYDDLRELVRAQNWYDKGYLANIVAYGISVFSKLFREQFKSPFRHELVWNVQSLPKDMADVLLPVCRKVKDCLTDPSRKKENVTEWAKLKACWDSVQESFDGYRLPPEAAAWGRSKEEVKERARQNRMDAGVESDVEFMKKAMAYEHWKDALDFIKDHPGIVTPGQRNSVSKCSFIPQVVPTTREIKVAFKALDELRSEGFRF